MLIQPSVKKARPLVTADTRKSIPHSNICVDRLTEHLHGEDWQTVLAPTPGRAPVMTRETRPREKKWSQTRKSAYSRVAKQRVRVSGNALIVNYK
ncbi:hypothetical protein NDU88_005729 [Pleurodeles waltl]|uniref:Uncharacterized protein n=1 Tax=Pleurodeles waltl TaxID=8319 RepID=A0AAV7UJ21_PLEWA|nr:hypothetical protein NDU88_005729 [Pleurodeles waltl]